MLHIFLYKSSQICVTKTENDKYFGREGVQNKLLQNTEYGVSWFSMTTTMMPTEYRVRSKFVLNDSTIQVQSTSLVKESSVLKADRQGWNRMA